jgi:simple sugar transport system substrate-binding protein
MEDTANSPRRSGRGRRPAAADRDGAPRWSRFRRALGQRSLRGLTGVVVAAAALLVATGCGGTSSSGGGGSTTASNSGGGHHYKFVVLVHGNLSGPFWNVLANGAQAAGKMLGDTVQLYPSTSPDPVVEGQNLQQIVASKPDGIVVTIPDPNALKSALQAANAAKIPLIITNSGADVASKYGLVYVGQDEFQGGYQSGQRLIQAGASNVVCVNQDVTNATVELRCQGLAKAAKEAGAKYKQIAIGITNPADNEQRVLATLSQDKTINGLMGTGVSAGDAIVDAVAANPSLKGRLHSSSFDIDQKTISGIRSGVISATVDQQQYDEGYLPIIFLNSYLRYGIVPAGQVSTGPNFVTADNVNNVVQLQTQGIR